MWSSSNEDEHIKDKTSKYPNNICKIVKLAITILLNVFIKAMFLTGSPCHHSGKHWVTLILFRMIQYDVWSYIIDALMCFRDMMGISIIHTFDPVDWLSHLARHHLYPFPVLHSTYRSATNCIVASLIQFPVSETSVLYNNIPAEGTGRQYFKL